LRQQVTKTTTVSMASKIAKFYAGRSVFITGGSGFVGKQIAEKLLRSCPEIDNIYLLMRPKRGENVEQRLKSLLQCQVNYQQSYFLVIVSLETGNLIVADAYRPDDNIK
jgi:FlaA1/EpsC-like NDP-sugar epimerase